MAKSKSRSRVRRDAVAIASDQLLDPPVLTRSGRTLLEYEDRRAFYPSPVFKPATRLDRGKRVFLAIGGPKPKAKGRSRVSPVIRFEAPQGVMICVRRSRRREVLFAKSKAGRGGMRRPRRNAWSNYSCRRS